MADDIDDCIIIGGGPAGLTAAIYLARFHLSIRLFDNESSRAALIPCTHNHAGYPEGIAGTELLARMLAQAETYGARRDGVEVTTIERDGNDFTVFAGDRRFPARAVLLATGVVNNRPDMPDDLHDCALATGLLRYCPICDGYEVTDKQVAVVGTGDHGMKEALFLRGYTSDITLISPNAGHDLDAECQAKLDDAGIARVDGPCGDWCIDGDRLSLKTADGRLAFDSVYPALGSEIRSELAVAAGAKANEEGCLEVDEDQRTTVSGLFAAGDVVNGLDQISSAMGQAGVAATAIRNLLDERQPIRR